MARLADDPKKIAMSSDVNLSSDVNVNFTLQQLESRA
jgi:hypothetical protein